MPTLLVIDDEPNVRYSFRTVFESDTVTVLTNKAVPAGEIDAAVANQQLAAAQASMAKTPEEQQVREKAERRARAMIRVAEKTAEHA